MKKKDYKTPKATLIVVDNLCQLQDGSVTIEKSNDQYLENMDDVI